jgi:hypothetical protein
MYFKTFFLFSGPFAVCPVINTRRCVAPAVVIVIYMTHLEVRLAVDKPRASPVFGVDGGCITSVQTMGLRTMGFRCAALLTITKTVLKAGLTLHVVTHYADGRKLNDVFCDDYDSIIESPSEISGLTKAVHNTTLPPFTARFYSSFLTLHSNPFVT